MAFPAQVVMTSGVAFTSAPAGGTPLYKDVMLTNVEDMELL